MDNKHKILDIAMNLNRIGNWAVDGYDKKQKRVIFFLKQTSEYLSNLNLSSLPEKLQKTIRRFLSEYKTLYKEGLNGPKDPSAWGERMMTWGNILTHRSKLI